MNGKLDAFVESIARGQAALSPGDWRKWRKPME